MSETESNRDNYAAVIVDPETEKLLGQISLVGDPVPATEWIRTNGPMQGFAVIEGWEQLQQVWISQEDVILRTNHGQRFIKIITYPTEGENQGYLDYTSDLQTSPKLPGEQKTRILAQRGFAFIQSLFSL